MALPKLEKYLKTTSLEIYKFGVDKTAKPNSQSILFIEGVLLNIVGKRKEKVWHVESPLNQISGYLFLSS